MSSMMVDSVLLKEKEEITNLVTEVEVQKETALNKLKNLQTDTVMFEERIFSCIAKMEYLKKINTELCEELKSSSEFLPTSR